VSSCSLADGYQFFERTIFLYPHTKKDVIVIVTVLTEFAARTMVIQAKLVG
jgi:hypothetical protein